MMIKCYSDLLDMNTIVERFEYLKLNGKVGRSTFGFDRYINQRFYHSPEWKRVRSKVIVRDDGCDLGIEGCDISGKILIHHMNPISIHDFVKHNPNILDPEFLICVSEQTHNAIHYGSADMLPKDPIIRTAGDTRLW